MDALNQVFARACGQLEQPRTCERLAWTGFRAQPTTSTRGSVQSPGPIQTIVLDLDGGRGTDGGTLTGAAAGAFEQLRHAAKGRRRLLRHIRVAAGYCAGGESTAKDMQHRRTLLG